MQQQEGGDHGSSILHELPPHGSVSAAVRINPGINGFVTFVQ